eukprot:22935-Pelagomonas_calceolata.AAC.1
MVSHSFPVHLSGTEGICSLQIFCSQKRWLFWFRALRQKKGKGVKGKGYIGLHRKGKGYIAVPASAGACSQTNLIWKTSTPGTPCTCRVLLVGTKERKKGKIYACRSAACIKERASH